MNFAIQNNNHIIKTPFSILAKVKKLKTELSTGQYAPSTNMAVSDCFVKSETTSDMLRKKCVEAAKSSKAREIAFLYNKDTDKIMGSYEGSSTSCLVDTKHYKKTNLEIHHSHPNVNGVYLPISFDDLRFLNKNENVTRIIAYGTKGQYTSLAKKKDYKKLNKKEMSDLEQDFMENLYLNATPEEREQINRLIKYCKDYPNDSNSIKAKCISLLIDLQKSENGARSIDSFWKQNASRLNLEYSGNFC